MGQLAGNGRPVSAPPRFVPPRARSGGTAGVTVAALLALHLVGHPLAASTPATFDSFPEELAPFTADRAARDPLAAEARCRAFVTALYHRLRTQGANPAWDPSEGQAEPLEWVMEVYFNLPPASAAVRTAGPGTGDLTRAYLDAFGPAALASALPDDPLYRNDKSVCDGVLDLAPD